MEGSAGVKHLYARLIEPIPGGDAAGSLEQQLMVAEDDDRGQADNPTADLN